MDSKLPNRRSIRLKGWDYTRPGWYFVTFNTHGSKALFGAVVNGQMILNEAGRIAVAEWRKSAALRRNLVLDEFVIMPNHVHGLVRIKEDGSHGGTEGLDASSPSFGKPVAGALGTFLGAYKAAVSRTIGRRGLGPGQGQPASERPEIWHRNYGDVIVREETALNNIRRYIRNNPQNYQAVMHGSELRYMGDRTLLDQPKVGFLASRGGATQHGHLRLNQGEVIISGFLSPMEQALFRAGLQTGKPMIWVNPWGLADSTDAPEVRRALTAGRLLVISPFDDTANAPAARRAIWCNHYVLTKCQRMVIGHLNPEGMLACILSEADPDLELVYL